MLEVYQMALVFFFTVTDLRRVILPIATFSITQDYSFLFDSTTFLYEYIWGAIK